MMAAMADPETLRAEMLERWDVASRGWDRGADRVRATAMPVSAWMIECLAPQPGQRLLELAAGPGDTGFLAAELIKPGGVLICSDGSDEMLAVARRRAEKQGIDNVEFKRLQLEWIDLEAASVDGVLCRWGVMLTVDPEAALREIRRVLRPGGRAALAVWDLPEHNPWITTGARALIELGHAEPGDPTAPGPFALSAEGALETLLANAGFVEPQIEAIDVGRDYSGLEAYLAEQLDLSYGFADARDRLSESEWAEVEERVARLVEPYAREGGGLHLGGRTWVACAEA